MSMDPDLDALALMHRDRRRAEAATTPIERNFAIGGHHARFHFAGPALVEPLTRAIAQLATDQRGEPDLTVHVWDSATTGVPLSPLLRALVDSLHGNPFTLLTPRHEIALLTNERVGATYELGSQVLTIYDRVEREAIYWVNDPDALPYYEKGAPFRTVLNWWLAPHQIHLIHAAAVGRPDGAVLLTGKGGSGKSTTALASLATSLQYVSDDYCAFSTASGPEVLSIYNTGKLRDEDDLARQPHFEPWVVNSDRAGDQKYLMYLAEHAPERLLLRAPLRAIVLPRVAAVDTPRLEPTSAVATLKALAPTSMFQLPGADGATFAHMAALVRQLPCYRLDCSPDLTATARVLEDLVADLSRE